MKQIIKHGNVVIRFTCRECQCIYECNKDDYAKAIEYDDENKNEIVSLHYYATCPECNAMNSVTKAPSMRIIF